MLVSRGDSNPYLLWEKCKLAEPLQKSACRFLKKLWIELSFVPAFPFGFERLSLKGQNYTWSVCLHLCSWRLWHILGPVMQREVGPQHTSFPRQWEHIRMFPYYLFLGVSLDFLFPTQPPSFVCLLSVWESHSRHWWTGHTSFQVKSG